MGQDIEGRFLIDKNPALTPSLPLILKAFPEAKIVLALRDPRNVVLSSFQLWAGVNSWSVGWLSLEDAAEQYAHAMGVWTRLRELLPEDRWVEVKYEDLVDDLETEGRRATAFLGLEWEEQQQKFYEHAQQKRVASPTYAAVTEKVYRTALDKWKNYEEHFEPILEKFDPWLDAFGYS